MKLYSNTLPDGGPLPQRAALCRPDPDAHVTFSDNRSPHLAWSGAPEGTQSYAILCVDPDAPSVGDDVNQEDREVSADLPRVDFFHWVLIDLPTDCDSLEEGDDSRGVTAGGKPPGPTAHGVRGTNNYTDFFASDAEMAGDYGGYDGPCPPWNDTLVHHYTFTVYALAVPALGLSGIFGGPEVIAAMRGHILASACITATYCLNPSVASQGPGPGKRAQSSA